MRTEDAVPVPHGPVLFSANLPDERRDNAPDGRTAKL